MTTLNIPLERILTGNAQIVESTQRANYVWIALGLRRLISHVEEVKRANEIPAEHPLHRLGVSLASDLRAVSDHLESLLECTPTGGEQLTFGDTFVERREGSSK